MSFSPKPSKRSSKQNTHSVYEPLNLDNSPDAISLDQPNQYSDPDSLKNLRQTLSNLNDKIEGAGYTYLKAMTWVFSVLFAAAGFFNFIKFFRNSSNRLTIFFDLIFYCLQAYQLRMGYESIVEKDAKKARKTFNYMLLFILGFTVIHVILLNSVQPRSFFEEHHIFDDKHEESAVPFAESQIQTMRRINLYMQEVMWILFLGAAFLIKRITFKIFEANQEINAQINQQRRKSS